MSSVCPVCVPCVSRPLVPAPPAPPVSFYRSPPGVFLPVPVLYLGSLGAASSESAAESGRLRACGC